MTWIEVAEFHRAWTGIATKDGVPVSLLCNPQKRGPYPDIIDEGRLVYYVDGPSRTHSSEKLRQAVGSGLRVRVFEKLADNEWRDIGFWTPTSHARLPQGYCAVTFERAG